MLNNTLLNNKWITEKIKEEIKIYIYLETKYNNAETAQNPMGNRKRWKLTEIESRKRKS